jgi:hypothetical protein
MLFVRDRVSDLFEMVYGYADNYLYTILVFGVSFIILISIGHKMAKEGRFWACLDYIIERIHSEYSLQGA